ncbi:MAG: hypothetical protein H7345_13075 [Rubritepida sp.]|nr:hypothetical protein [Rubritepida sp.]
MRARREASLTTIRAAAEALLPVLDDAQKAKAHEVLPGLVARGPGMMRHAGMGMPGTGPAITPAR